MLRFNFSVQQKKRRAWARITSLGMVTALGCGLMIAQATPSPSSSAIAGTAATSVTDNLSSSLRQLRSAIDNIGPDQGRGKATQRAEFAQDANSIARNLDQAMPGLLSEFRNSPQNLATAFKLYRDADAVYQVALRAVESANAFSKRGQTDALAGAVEGLRHQIEQLADYIQINAAAQHNEIEQMRRATQQSQTAPLPGSSKPLVIDANGGDHPVSKHPRKRKKTSPSSASGDSSKQPPGGQQNPTTSPPQSQ